MDTCESRTLSTGTWACLACFGVFSYIWPFKTVEVDLEEIVTVNRVKMAVHGTTLRAWELIGKYTLPSFVLFEV